MFTSCAAVCLFAPVAGYAAPPPAQTDPVNHSAMSAPRGLAMTGHPTGPGPAPGHSWHHWVSPPAQHLPPLTGWDKSVRGPDRPALAQRWRIANHDWDRAAPWRSDHFWWRRYPGFRWFFGFRVGYFFFPEVGYVVAPPELANQYWSIGGYLPAWFLRYVVNDYAVYGLPPPPEGCGWIWLDGDVALVDLSDGYIIDLVRNIW